MQDLMADPGPGSRAIGETPEASRASTSLPYLTIEQFLDADEHAALMRTTLDEQASFVGSAVTKSDVRHWLPWRVSHTLYEFPVFAERFKSRITALLPDVCARLGVAPFEIEQIETQLTSHNHGHYFKAHTDSGDAETASRMVSYVYYFFAEPQMFAGGELIFLHTAEDGTIDELPVAPVNNRMIFFASDREHRVAPVSCPSRQFGHGRFTVNGWVRRPGRPEDAAIDKASVY
jgi:SM-20-related protein